MMRRPTGRLVVIVLGCVIGGLLGWIIVDALSGHFEPVALLGLVLALITLGLDYASHRRDTRPQLVELEEEAENLSPAGPRRLPERGCGPPAGQHRDAAAELVRGGRRPRRRSGLDDRGRAPVAGGPGCTAASTATCRRPSPSSPIGTGEVPDGRLVVLGEPGAGKSALVLLLTLGLLRAAAGPAAGAGPGLGRRPGIPTARPWTSGWSDRSPTSSTAAGRSCPSACLQAGLLLPVLDGLDEMPEINRRVAIKVINSAIRDTRPLVLTCRTAEYTDLVRGGSRALRRAPVVQRRPGAPGRRRSAHLGPAPWPAGTSWEPVFRVLTGEPEAPVTEALSTPLMVGLAQTIYQRLDRRPAELLDRALFGSKHAVEGFLTDQIIDAAYAPGPGLRGAGAGTRWQAADARRWLSLLAHDMYRHRDRELSWWLLSGRLLSTWVAPAIGLLGGLLVMVAVTCVVGRLPRTAEDALRGAERPGGRAAHRRGVRYRVRRPAHDSLVLGRHPGARQGLARPHRLRRPVAHGLPRRGIGHGAGHRSGARGHRGDPVRAGYVDAAQPRALRRRPARGDLHGRGRRPGGGAALVADRAIGAGGPAVAGGEPAVRPPGRARRLERGRRSPPGCWSSRCCWWASSPAASPCCTRPAGWGGPARPDPWAVVVARRYDIRVFFEESWALGIGAMLLVAVVFFALFFLTHPWSRFAVCRLAQALRRELPLDLSGFLADARDRDLLRHASGAYLFRHGRLQESLVIRNLGGGRSSEEQPARSRGPPAVGAAGRGGRGGRPGRCAGGAAGERRPGHAAGRLR